ncbi:putative histone-arginine methyltransferase 1.4 [Vitis vinifera]|uniref:type I protein arginine methyltransferase n=1 Tax=Vitis vinifera TaxID=29760 RepID=A0A438KL64_VITVI|nr:putative histone-arginine methyltransferase 1.4 [Vitis vinifera]
MSSLNSVLLSPSSLDSRAWSLSSSGSFSVKSFFYALSKVSNPLMFLPAKFLWSSKVPSKVKALAWLFNLVGVIWVPPRSLEDMWNNRIFEDKGRMEEMVWDLIRFYSSLWASCTEAFRGVPLSILQLNWIGEEELYEIEIPLKFISLVGARVHGLACWFDVLFNGSTVQRWLTTAPGAPTTHWYQLRCVLLQPLYVMAGQEITGQLRLVAHNAQSYTIHLTMGVKMWGPGAEQGEVLQSSSCKLDLKEPYYRMSQPQAYTVAPDQQQHPLIHAQDIHIQGQDADEPDVELQ